MAVDDWPLLRWRMREYTHGRWGTQIVKKNQRLADDIVAAVAELGPSTAGQIEAHLGAEQRGKKGPWWDRSDTKWVTEALFAAGVLTTATRVGFARHYDLTESVLPPEVVAREVDDDEAVRELTLRAAGALGVGDRGRHPRLLPAGAAAGQARHRQAGRRRGAGARRGRRLDGAGVSAGRPDRAAAGSRDGAAVSVRPVDLLPAAGGAAVRLPLPHRDLRARAETPIRLLRLAFPARRSARRSRRPEGRTTRVRCMSSALSSNRASSGRGWPALAAELRTMAAWLGLADVTVGTEGDLVGELGTAIKRG